MNTASIEVRMSPDEDRALWRRWLGGDAGAGGALSRRLHPALRSFFASKAVAGDVEDLIQQVWLALGETLRRHPDVEIATSVRAYLLGVARYVLFRHIRQRARGGAIDPIESSIAALEPSLSQIVGRELEAQRMLRALQRLPVDIQILLELRYVQNLTSAELASLYAIAEGTVKSRLARARRLLEDELKQGGTTP